jgi:hypothetical protein
MHAEAQMPMRTEDDVRAALLALEDQAPSAEKVLTAVRAAGSRRGPGRARALRSPRSPRWPQLVTAVATAAAAAGLTIALLPGGAPSGSRSTRPGQATIGPASAAPATPGLPSATALGKAMLTASTAATGDILYTTQTSVNRGVTMDIYQDWIWPANPVPGQQARWREAFSQRLSRTKPLLLTEKDSFTYTVPPGNPDSERAIYAFGHLTVVCYAGTGQTGCGFGNTETPAGTWSEHTRKFVNPGAGAGDWSPAGLARGIAKGQWRVTGRTKIGGQPAIELAETRTGSLQPLPTTLWVSARTHLPIRMINGAGAMVTQFGWYYLKPTAANMALLRVSVPPGYQRSG